MNDERHAAQTASTNLRRAFHAAALIPPLLAEPELICAVTGSRQAAFLCETAKLEGMADGGMAVRRRAP